MTFLRAIAGISLFLFLLLAGFFFTAAIFFAL